MNSVGACVVITTINDKDGAEQLAQAVINAGLGACVQIQPVRSYYRWQGQVEADDEFRLDIKTLDRVFEPLRALIQRLHPYETPEIIQMSIVGVSPEYFAWMADSITIPSADSCLDI